MESPTTNHVKYIRTSDGPKLKESFDPNMNTLPYEHICQNICDYLIKTKLVYKEDDEINLKNISDVSINIYSYLKNLYLDSDSTKCADELNLLKEYNCGLVVDATTRKNGQNTKNLREIAKLSGINICFGYTLKEDFFKENINFNFEQIHNEIRYELVYGYDDLIPSFLGEIIISESNIFPYKNEENYFDILFKVVEEFQIPIFIKLNYSSLTGKNNIFQYFENKISNMNVNKKLLVFIYSKQIENETEINLIKDQILSRGFSIVLCLFDCDIVLANRIKENKLINGSINDSGLYDTDDSLEEFFKLPTFFNKEKLNMLTKLILLENKKYIYQILISNNINFRTQLKKWGGFGYSNFFKNYLNKLVKLSQINREESRLILNENLLNLLSWWEPPKKNLKKVKMITCFK